VGLNEASDENLVDLRVPVNQHIAEGNEAPVLGDAFRRLGISFGELAHRFTDDLELSLHGGLQHDAMLIVGEGLPSGEPTDQSGRLIDVKAVFERLDR
jgi:hypothetical protein